MHAIDLNADVGEGVGDDRAMIAAVTSANIACGGHAGDPATMKAAVQVALEHGVAIGAHPGHVDRGSFGRRERPILPEDARLLVARQIDRLAEVADRERASVRYVKLHGALYHQTAQDAELAAAVVDAIVDHAERLGLLGQSGTKLHAAAERRGVAFYGEAFADRAYLLDGSLAPRSVPGAKLVDESDVVGQAKQIVLGGAVDSLDGKRVSVSCRSLCLHGDGPHAVQFARAVRWALEDSDVRLQPFVDTH